MLFPKSFILFWWSSIMLSYFQRFERPNVRLKSMLTVNLPFCPVPTYPRVKPDGSLTFCHYLGSLRKKLLNRIMLLRQLAGSGWSAGAKTLHTIALSLVCSTAEYCSPVWYHSEHTLLISDVLNEALRIVTECLCSISTDHLPILSGI